MMFGGESTDLANRSATWDLSSDVHTTFFSSKQATFAKLYTSCHTGVACPQARRDAAVTTMSNSASSNGVLLVYGGFGCGNPKGCVGSGMYDLMNGNFPTYATAFNDLWYLIAATQHLEGSLTSKLAQVSQPHQPRLYLRPTRQVHDEPDMGAGTLTCSCRSAC